MTGVAILVGVLVGLVVGIAFGLSRLATGVSDDHRIDIPDGVEIPDWEPCKPWCENVTQGNRCTCGMMQKNVMRLNEAIKKQGANDDAEKQ